MPSSHTHATLSRLTRAFTRPLPTELPYRPEIDGLRALAVIAVICHHAGFGCPGGYVGVDVFFVISGFLITSLIWRDLQGGRFSFARFWERRARRIAPALVTMTTLTLIVGWCLLLPEELSDLGQTTAAQSVFAANVDAWWSTGYFTAAAQTRPLLHTWSLAVEEQFYLLVPLLLWGLFRLCTREHRTMAIALLATIGGLSLAAAMIGVERAPAATYYLLPTRAWELIVGALLALMPATRPISRRNPLREGLAMAGLILVVGPVFLYSRSTPFPGVAALPPCLGTALVIRCTDRIGGRPRTVVGILLGLQPLVSLGLISYSLYLWHWPLLALDRSLTLVPPTALRRAMLVGGAIPLALLSWLYVERPFRERRLCKSRRSLFLWTGAALALLLVMGVAAMSDLRHLGRDRERSRRYATTKADQAFDIDVSLAGIRNGDLVAIGSRTAGPPKVLVWGDSHAMAVLPAIDALLKERHLAGRAVTYRATAPVVDWFTVRENGLGPAAVAWNQAVIDHLEYAPIPTVILIARWHIYLDPDDPSSLPDAMLATVRRLVSLGIRPWIMLEVPQHTFDIPRALADPRHDRKAIDAARAKPLRDDELDWSTADGLVALTRAGARILDPRPSFLDATGHYVIERDGDVLYRDDHHLTVTGSIRVLLPWLRQAFPQMPPSP